MTAVAIPGSRIAVRDARPADNEALLALTAASPMAGSVRLCIERGPDFFALNRLEGERWRVGVAEDPEAGVVGCVAVAERSTYLHGRLQPTAYLGDLKVHPRFRGTDAADLLTRYCVDAGRAIGPGVPGLLTILAGNHAMERRIAGPRGLPRLRRFATIRAHSVSVLWRRRMPRAADVVVRRAEAGDLEEMAALWARVAPRRQFAPAYDAASLAAWIGAAPGLDVSDYLLARRRDGRLAGFCALWDQDCFKRLRVLGYAPGAALFRVAFNALAPFAGATRLPPVGAPLRYRTAVHVCVARGDPGVFRALLVAGHNALRGRGYAFFTVGLDVGDPLSAALRGFFAQPTDVHAYVSTALGDYDGPPLDDRPLHYEIALV